jgi:hypothetical protein
LDAVAQGVLFTVEASTEELKDVNRMRVAKA